MNNKLILRSLESPFSDITKNSKLTIADGDNNFIFLKGSDLSAATTTGTVLSLIKNNGEIINVDISSVSGGTGQNTAIVSGTFSNETLTLYNTTGGTVVVTGITSSGGSSGVEVFVTGATANNGNKTYTFTNNTGGTFVVTGLTDITITGASYSNGTLTLVNTTGGTLNITGFTTGSSNFDVYVTGATGNNNNKTYTFTNNLGNAFTLNALTDITIVSGNYNSGTLTLNNTTGGTITITGLTASAGTDTYVTGATTNNDNKTYTFTNNTGNSFIVTGLTDITITGGTFSTGGTLTLNNNTGGTFSITGFATNNTFTTGSTLLNNIAYFNNNNQLSAYTLTLTGLSINDNQVTFSDNIINNVSSSNHGYAPKLPNDSTVYLDGTGNYTTPSGIYNVGTIINEPCNSLSAWTQTGSEFSVSSGRFAISSSVGSISFASYIRQTQYGTSDLENTTITAELTIGNITSTSFGVGVGYYSQQATFKKSLTIGFLMDSTNKGKIAFYFNNLVTGAVISPNAIAINSGDVTTIKIRQVKSTFIVTWTNGSQSITSTYTFFLNNTTLNPTIVTNMPNVFNYSIYSLGGGTHFVDNFIVKSDEKKYPSFLFIGDSIIKGYNLGTISRRAIDIIAESTQLNISSLSNGGNYVSDINIPEALSFSANTVIFSLGINDITNGVSVSALMAKYATVLSAFTGAGYVLGSTFFFTTIRPYSGFDVTSANTQIRSTYPNGYIELYYPFAASSASTAMNTTYVSSDNLHLNEYGAMLEASIYMNFFDLKTKISINFNNKGIFSDQQGRVAIGVGNIARYPLDVLGSTSQLRLGGSTNDNGGFLGSFNSDGVEIYGGLVFNGINYTIKATNYGGISTFAGDIYFWGAKTTTIGNTIASPTALGLLTANGRLYLGGAVTPTATIHSKAGVATPSGAPFKYTNGVSGQTIVENGTKNYDGSNEYLAVSGINYTIAKTLTTTATLDFPITTANSSSDLTIAITGVSDGDIVNVGPPNGSILPNTYYSAFVSATNVVTVRFNNYDTITKNPDSGVFRISIIKY